jgi:C_GCAxxG_C_C family probable redox protein
MAIGMKMGRMDSKDKEAIAKVYAKCQEFWDQFEKEFGSNSCYNLTGFHLDSEAERQRWLDTGGKEKCMEIVKKTASLLCGFLNPGG